MIYSVETVVRDRAIVVELARMRCPTSTTNSGEEDCVFCGHWDALEAAPDEHEPDCLWRRARAAYPNEGSTT